ncbi:MAG: formyltransferase family protein [bacterium]
MRKRIYIIISEEPVFHPVLAEGLVRELSPEHDIVGFTLAIGDTRQIGAATRLAETFGMFGFRAFACLALQNVTYKVFAALGLRQLGVPFSVSQVAAGHGIPCVTSFNVNDAEHLALLKTLHPDIVISSNGHIFRRELLAIPAIACVNRHTSLLPRYGGLWPVFHAMLNGERTIGQTIHTMTSKIDSGYILAQEEFINDPAETTLYGIYSRSFKSAPALVRKAIENLLAGRQAEMPSADKSYFRHPTPAEGRAFRAKCRFFRIMELFRRCP